MGFFWPRKWTLANFFPYIYSDLKNSNFQKESTKGNSAVCFILWEGRTSVYYGESRKQPVVFYGDKYTH